MLLLQNSLVVFLCRLHGDHVSVGIVVHGVTFLVSRSITSEGVHQFHSEFKEG